MIETPVPDTTNATRDVESEFDAGQEGKIREIVMDNVESEPVVCNLAINQFLACLRSREICCYTICNVIVDMEIIS